MLRYLADHAIALFFGALVGLAIKRFPPSGDTALEWILGGFLFFLIYSFVLEAIKRWSLFWTVSHHRIRGLYAEVYLREPDCVVVAPFLVSHHVASDELIVLGRAFTVTANGEIQPRANVSWKSKAISLTELPGETHELAYLFTGQRDGAFNIHGTTRVGVPIAASGDRGPRRGYFIDTDITEPALGATQGKPFGPIEDLPASVGAVRFFSIKFDSKSYQVFKESCDRTLDKILLSLKVSCEPNEESFQRFLEQGGLKFLADHTPDKAGYQDILRILKGQGPATASATVAAPAAPIRPPASAAPSEPVVPGG